MIKSVSVRNFQSLRSVDLELGRLTVIVGASNSGKSALVRALRALASNLRGTSAITRGAKVAAVQVVLEDGHKVTLERSEAAGVYRVVTPDVDGSGGQELAFTKLNAGVPEQVTRALRIAPVPTGGVSVNFARQLDPPYLLDDTGSIVARVLGELTNVDTIFAAGREANRRRGNLATTLRTREKDLGQVTGRASGFATLPARLAACARAEEAAERANDLSSRGERLRSAADTLAVADAVLARHRALPPVPSDTVVTTAQARRDRFRALLADWITAEQATTTAHAAIGTADQGEQVEHQRLHAVLAAAGTCPTCNQPIG